MALFPTIFTFYFCSKNPLLDAEMATPCGHTFCGFCVGVFKTTSGAITCEMCRQPVVTFVKNHLANTMLRMVDGECNWCKKTIALNTAKDHLQTCEEVVLKCKECQTALKRRHLETHKATCEMVDVQCDCGVAFKRKDEKNHMERTCNLFEVPCPLKCGENIKR